MKRSMLFLCLLSLAAFGCADPTADKPKAEVEAPAPAPEPVAGGVVLPLAEGTTLGFVGSKVTGSHEGGFNTFAGNVTVADNDLTQSSISLTIDTTSIWTDTENLTGHLKSPDFFDVAKFPQASFTSTEIRQEAEGYTMVGNLDLHGVTKSISFPASIEMTDGMVKATAEFAIKRFDFAIEYKGKADNLIRDDVLIKLNVIAGPAAG
jgi:polyisoprenoid-binding protein YceI